MGKPLKEIQQHKKDKKLDSKGPIFNVKKSQAGKGNSQFLKEKLKPAIHAINH